MVIWTTSPKAKKKRCYLNFIEELNQGAEKAFGENAQAMIDSLLYAKLPPKLKRSVNMARLENATHEEIVTHLERELELNGLEEGDDLRVPTMSTAPTATRPGTGLLSSGIDPNTVGLRERSKVWTTGPMD